SGWCARCSRPRTSSWRRSPRANAARWRSSSSACSPGSTRRLDGDELSLKAARSAGHPRSRPATSRRAAMSFEPDDLDVDDETAPFARFPGACDADQHLAEQHEHLLAAALAFGRLARRELASAAELEQARLQLLYAA